MLHFGTHGSLEFMPGKQVGMSGVCYPDSLIGTIPNLYYYAANNPSGGCTAPQRSAVCGLFGCVPVVLWDLGAEQVDGLAGCLSQLSSLSSMSSLLPLFTASSPFLPPPAEATIAKRRSYANTISYLTPPAENAGLYKGLKELKELISSYQSMRDSGRAVAICSTIIETARQCNLDKVRGPGGGAAGWWVQLGAGCAGRAVRVAEIC